jgi:O-antigen/teichoic acid export membrane protein
MILNRMLKALTLSGLILAINIVGQLFSVPILTAHWGVRTYGAWVALTSLGASVTLMNLGMQSHVSNQLILATAQDRRRDAERLLGSALKVYGVFCLTAMGMIAGGLCFLNLPDYLDTAGLTAGASASIVLAHALLAVYAIVGGLLINLLRVGGELPRQLAYGVVERILILFIPMGVALLGASPQNVSWGTVSAVGICAAYMIRDVMRRSPVRIQPSTGTLREGFQLVGPSLLFFGSALSSQLLTTGVTLVTSAAAGSVAVATFATAMIMTNLLRSIVNQFINVVSGEITLLLGRNELARLADWYRFLWKGCVSAAIAAAVLLCPFGPQFIRLWTQGRVQIDLELNFLLTLYLIIHTVGIVSAAFGLAMNRQGSVFLIQLGTGVGTVVMSILLVRRMGLHGIALSLLAMQSVCSTALTLMNCRWQYQSAWRFLGDAVGRGIPTFAFAAAGVTTTHRLDNLASAAIATLLTIAGCFLLTWLTWLNPDEQHWLRGRIRQFFQQRKLRPAGLTV